MLCSEFQTLSLRHPLPPTSIRITVAIALRAKASSPTHSRTFLLFLRSEDAYRKGRTPVRGNLPALALALVVKLAACTVRRGKGHCKAAPTPAPSTGPFASRFALKSALGSKLELWLPPAHSRVWRARARGSGGGSGSRAGARGRSRAARQ
jgi:hypothetical protein